MLQYGSPFSILSVIITSAVVLGVITLIIVMLSVVLFQ
jgi:hypothetical protein